MAIAMVVRISCMYSDDFDVEYYEEGERIRIGQNAISASFMILADEDQDEALDGREGEKYGQNLTRAAEALDVSHNTVRKYL